MRVKLLTYLPTYLLTLREVGGVGLLIRVESKDESEACEGPAEERVRVDT